MTTLIDPMLEFNGLFNRMLSANGLRGAFVPAADVVGTDGDVVVYMDVPGLRADDLEIELENEVLTVRGERTYPYSTNGKLKGWQRIERGFGKFERSVHVPSGLDPDAIAAELADGVLTVRIPKPEALKPHRVEITANSERRQLEGAVA